MRPISRPIAPALLAVAWWAAGCGQSDPSYPPFTGNSDADADTDADADADADTDTDVDTDSDTDTDTGTGSSCEEDCAEQGMVCNEGWGICVVASCEDQDDFTPCLVITVPDRSLDICVDQVCVSPGCGDASCNVPGPHFPLADTNQRKCYTATVAIGCPPPGQVFYGQDAHYGWDTMSDADQRYTRDLSTPGEPVVADNVTGLVWQGCARGRAGDDCQTGGFVWTAWTEAPAYCDGLEWGGSEDWRLPDEYELLSLLDHQRLDMPLIDEVAFPSSGMVYWSSSTCAWDDSRALMVAHSFGAWDSISGILPWEKSAELAVRCVRSGPMGTRRLEPSVISGQRVVLDTATGLMWQGCPRGRSGDQCQSGGDASGTWQHALAYCNGLSWAGHDDWRLPNGVELVSISSSRFSAPSINPVAFPNTPASGFWSSTTRANSPDSAWRAHLDTGYLYQGMPKTSDLHTRCVRDE